MRSSGTHRNDRLAGRVFSLLLLVALASNVVLTNLPSFTMDFTGLEWMELIELEHEGKDHADGKEIDKYETPVTCGPYLRLFLSNWMSSLKQVASLDPVGFIEISSPPPEPFLRQG